MKYNFDCNDCGMDTTEEYYMLTSEVWKEAVAKAPASILCISCVERRLGRMLNAVDFAQVPLNYIPMIRTPLLAHRLLRV